MNLAEIIKFKYPDAEFKLQDDGNGPYMAEWNILETLPTEADLNTWEQEYLDSDIYKSDQFVKNNAELINQLNIIDQKTIRALRENNIDRLRQLETQAQEIRSNFVK